MLRRCVFAASDTTLRDTSRFCKILTGLSRSFPWQEETRLTSESYARGSDFYRLCSKPLLCLFYPRGGEESITCLQISEKKFFMGVGRRMLLATNEQKGRSLKLSSWDAFFLLLAAWVDLVFLEAWLVCHTCLHMHTHRENAVLSHLNGLLPTPDLQLLVLCCSLQGHALGMTHRWLQPTLPKVAWSVSFKRAHKLLFSRSERRIMNKILGKDLWTMP